MAHVTQAEFASLMGLSRPYIAKLVTNGVIQLSETGQIDPKAAIEAMKAAGESTAFADTMSLADFARYLGCKPSYITKLKQAGRLVLTEDGRRVKVTPSKERIEATRDPAKAQNPTTPETPDEAATNPNDPTTVTNPDYQAARAKREHYNALQAEADYRAKIRDLLEAPRVRAILADILTELRGQLESLPYTLSPALAAETSEQTVQSMLQTEIENALAAAAQRLEKLGQGQFA